MTAAAPFPDWYLRQTFPGWHLLGAFPDHAPDDVGSWLLHHNGEAMLLEVPPGVTPAIVRAGLDHLSVELRCVTASHTHEDHLDYDAWADLQSAFPAAEFLDPSTLEGDRMLTIGGEPVWLIKAPKHSPDDVVTVFRGTTMTGDIELQTLSSVNREVPMALRKKSMRWLRDFQARTGYRVNSIVSAHLNDWRTNIDWPTLFEPTH
jgi:hydroxyacylglutathione hydrolase